MTDAEKLADAKAKLHLLVTGQLARVYVDQNGERVEYTAANEPRLRRYIADLEALVGPTTTTTTGPMQVIG